MLELHFLHLLFSLLTLGGLMAQLLLTFFLLVLQQEDLPIQRLLCSLFLKLISLLGELQLVDVALISRPYFNLKSLFLDDLVLELLLQLKELLAVELVLNGVLLSQLAQFDLHLDQIFALSPLSSMNDQLELVDLLLVLVILLSDLSLDHGLLIHLDVKLAHLLLQVIDSFSVHLLLPEYFLILCRNFCLKALANFLLDAFYTLYGAHLALVHFLSKVVDVFIQAFNLLILGPLKVSKLLRQCLLITSETLNFLLC